MGKTWNKLVVLLSNIGTWHKKTTDDINAWDDAFFLNPPKIYIPAVCLLWFVGYSILTYSAVIPLSFLEKNNFLTPNQTSYWINVFAGFPLAITLLFFDYFRNKRKEILEKRKLGNQVVNG